MAGHQQEFTSKPSMGLLTGQQHRPVSKAASGFGGVRDSDGRLSFAPRLPSGRKELAFSLRFCDRQIRVQRPQ